MAGVKAADGHGYIGSRTDTTQQSGQTPDKEIGINHITVYISGYTETDTTGMLSPNNGRLSGANKVRSFQADSLARYVLQCAQDLSVIAVDKTYLTEDQLDVTCYFISLLMCSICSEH